MTEPLFKNINIIGLGLIGGSIAYACKKFLPHSRIYAFDTDKTQTDIALEENAIDGIYNFEQSDAEDLIIICAPLSAYKSIFQKIEPALGSATIIDIGSLKGFTLPLADEIFKTKSVNFIACHPIAGSDKSGFLNSDQVSYLGKKVIITPNKTTNKIKLEKIKEFWKKVTHAEPEEMDAQTHDKIFTLVSHLPQFLSFIAKENYKNGSDEILNRHLRIQHSNKEMWSEIFNRNQFNIKYYLEFFERNIDKAINSLNSKNLDCHVACAPRNDSVNDYFDRSDATSLRRAQATWQSRTNKIQELILRRLFLSQCFVEIPDISKYEEYAGTGFKDFTAILEYSNILKENPEILKNHKEQIIEFLKEIKNKIQHYEFS